VLSLEVLATQGMICVLSLEALAMYTLTPPHKMMGGEPTINLDLRVRNRAEDKPLICKNIGHLIMSRNELDENITIKHIFPNKMIIHLNMFGLCMEHGIRGQS
jgi:hypothetical protein